MKTTDCLAAMEAYEDEDDTHYCIKCSTTIQGLENYVRHRQTGCGTKEVLLPPSTPATVSYPEILNADAFFSSLELQSSSKSNPPRTASGDRSRKTGRSEDRKRKNRKDKSPEDCNSSKEKLHNILPVVTDLDDPIDHHLGIPSLVGFPDIVSTSKLSSSGKMTCHSQMVSSVKIDHSDFHGKQDSMESIMSKQLDRKREDTHRLDPDHQDWLEDTILVDVVGNSVNKDVSNSSLSRYEDCDYQDEESEEESIEEDVQIEDSFSESDDEDRPYPPQGHTGGKWKPGHGSIFQMSQDITHDLLDEDVEMIVEDDEEQHHPPPSHTGGKWKPMDSNYIHKPEEEESKVVEEQPPPGHTKGKWVPGEGADTSTGYWCSPCGRNLTSRVLYNRHLGSFLHAKRSMQDIDSVVQFPQSLHRKIRKQKDIADKTEKATEDNDEKYNIKKRLRKREKEFLTCEMCCARVRRPQMGKHLLSHYHCRVAGANPYRAKAQQFLLENMENVVRQCSFQCAPCRFYCNTEDTFLLHWRSYLHLSNINKINGSFKCSPCAFWCDENSTMEIHLRSSSHRELVAMMNGSIPVVISRQCSLMCHTCDQSFRYNIQLSMHARQTDHDVGYTATDEYQKRITCNVCGFVVRSLIALQRHQLTAHLKDGKTNLEPDFIPAPYFCSFCSLSFETAKDAVVHRRTGAHKEVVKATKSENPSTVKVCPNCKEQLPNIHKYKAHLLDVHPELCYRCPKCAMVFAFSQDVAKHTRDGACVPDKNQNIPSNEVEWRCNLCPFATDLQSEFIFHEALHNGPIQSGADEPGSSQSSGNYRCPLCKKCFSKATLRNHIRGHTGDRPFPCSRCSLSFARRNDLNIHRKLCEGFSSSELQDESGRRRDFACGECNNAFFTKHALRQHMMRHQGKQFKCGLPGCATVLRSQSELKSHQIRVHGSPHLIKQVFQCSHCNYSAKIRWQLVRHERKHEEPDNLENSKQYSCPFVGCNFRAISNAHIKRHVRTIHTNEKPYKCRHCKYASSTLENLRKHVLLTTLHIGKTIYECDICTAKGVKPFCTNFSKELRAHLVDDHSDRFPAPEDVNNYIANIFDTNQDDSRQVESLP